MKRTADDVAHPLRGLSSNDLPISEILRQAIRIGILRPGTPLVQETLAEILGVSRIPVRESLRTLAAEGLVVFQPGRGAVVSELSPADIDELYSLRILLETAMAESIVARVTPHELAAVKSLVSSMDHSMTEDARDAWAQANFKFHELLYAIARMPHSQRFAVQVLTLTEIYSRIFVFNLGGLQESQMEHHQMVEAIEARDARFLEKSLLKHSNRAREGLLAYVSEEESARHVFEMSRVADPVRALSALTDRSPKKKGRK